MLMADSTVVVREARSEPRSKPPRLPFVSVGDQDGIAVVHVRGDVNRRVSRGLRDILAWAVDNHDDVVVDLSAVVAIDRSGLSVLLQSQDRAHQRGSRLCFAEPSPDLRVALARLRADAMFPMMELCSAAVTLLRSRASR